MFQVKEAQRELAWVSEKYTLELEKLRSKFLSPILVENITLQYVYCHFPVVILFVGTLQ